MPISFSTPVGSLVTAEGKSFVASRKSCTAAVIFSRAIS